MWHSKSLFAAPLVLIACGAAWLLPRVEQAKDLSDPARARHLGRPIPVRTARVSEEQAEEVIGSTALTEPSATTNIRVGPTHSLGQTDPVSEVTLKAVHIREGEQVSQGQLLFELNDAVLAQVLRQREIALSYMVSKLKRVEKQVSYNELIRELNLSSATAERSFRAQDLDIKDKLHHVFELLNQKMYVSKFDFYDAASNLAEAKYRRVDSDRLVERTEAQLNFGRLGDEEIVAQATNDQEKARLDLEMARHDVERCQIKSPIAGFVGRVNLAPGVVIGVFDVLTQVIKLDPLRIRVDLPQEKSDRVWVGQKAEFVADSLPDEMWTGRVVSVGALVNPELRVLPVLVELANPEYRIKAGVSGFVKLLSSRRMKTIPSSAVFEVRGKSMVFCVEDGRARAREIRVGDFIDAEWREVRSGLEPGQEVVIYHDFYSHTKDMVEKRAFLQDGDRVDTDWMKWTRRGAGE